MHHLAVFAESAFEALKSFETPQARDGYRQGVEYGAGLYSGSAGGYRLPEDEQLMGDEQPVPEAIKATAAYRAALDAV